MKNTNLTELNTAMKDSHLHMNQQTGNKPLVSRLLTLILAGLVLPLGSLTFSGCGKDEQAEMKEAIAKEMAKPIQHRRMMPDDMTLDEIIQQLKKYAQTGEAGVEEIELSIYEKREYGPDTSYETCRYDGDLLKHYNLLCDGMETIKDYPYLCAIRLASLRGPASLPLERYIRSLIHLGAKPEINNRWYMCTGGKLDRNGNRVGSILYDGSWNTETVKQLINDYKKSPELFSKDFINNLLLDIRASGVSEEKIKILLEAGADVNIKDSSGQTTLMQAARGVTIFEIGLKHKEEDKGNIARLLLKHGADVNAKANNGMTALMYAADNKNDDVAKLLLEHGADVNAKDKDGRTALMIAGVRGCEGVAKLLLEHGVDVNAKDNDGRTALRIAVPRHWSKGVAKLLLEHGADANTKDNSGRTPLIIAVEERSEEWARLLLEHGADANAKDNDGRDPLIIAANMPCPASVELLLEHGADANTKDNTGKTALMFAFDSCRRGWGAWITMAPQLLKHGADVNAKTNNGMTALMYAADARDPRDSIDFAKLLLDHGADVNAKDNSGRTALMIAMMIARARDDWRLVQLLRQHGADDRTEE